MYTTFLRSFMRRMTVVAFAGTALVAVSACSQEPVHSSPAILGQDAVVDLSRVTNGVPRFFTYRYHGRNISFFVIKTDRKIVSFLDACTSCFAHKRGYRCEDATVTCRHCNVRFSIYNLEKGLGGCYPIRLEGRLEKGTYRIPLKALQAEAGKF